jgi:hypothetical protein
MKLVRKSLLVAGFSVSGCAFGAGEVPGEAEVESDALGVKTVSYEVRTVPDSVPGYDLFAPLGVAQHGDVYGLALDCDDEFIVCAFDALKLGLDGNLSLVAEDFSVSDVNDHGDLGGCAVDPETQIAQAAIAHPNGNIELIPRLPGEFASCVLLLSDAETALVQSFDAEGVETYSVFRNGNVYPVALPASANLRDINDKGLLAGIVSTANGDRAFRFDSQAQTLALLEPVAGDPDSWGLGLNHQGEVLGYSFFFSAQERIGKWNKQGEFQTSFIEGTPEFPTVSNQLIWNKHEFIVVSDTNDGNTYVIPQPGVRLDVAGLVDGAVVPPLFAYSIDSAGDFLAQTLDDFTYRLFVRTH